MTTWSATDWMLRPRRPDELDVSQGGGVVYRRRRTRWTACACWQVARSAAFEV